MDLPPPSGLPRLLLIDDDFISREVLALVLETYGFPIESAADGPEALALLDQLDQLDQSESVPPEIILMDNQMPGLSGLDLIAALRSRSSARIIAISGSEVDESIKQATDGFLLKPIEAADVTALLAASVKDIKPAVPDETAVPAELIAIESPVDPIVLGKLQAMMPAKAVREIYAATATDLRTRLTSLEAAMTAANTPEVQRIAHSIKGGSAMVGLSAATQAANRLETSDLTGLWPAELAQLVSALEALEGMLLLEFPV
jgi:CheY-like chemotaxis protein